VQAAIYRVKIQETRWQDGEKKDMLAATNAAVHKRPILENRASIRRVGPFAFADRLFFRIAALLDRTGVGDHPDLFAVSDAKAVYPLVRRDADFGGMSGDAHGGSVVGGAGNPHRSEFGG